MEYFNTEPEDRSFYETPESDEFARHADFDWEGWAKEGDIELSPTDVAALDFDMRVFPPMSYSEADEIDDEECPF